MRRLLAIIVLLGPACCGTPVLADDSELDQALALIEQHELSLGATRIAVSENSRVHYKGAEHTQSVTLRMAKSSGKFRTEVDRFQGREGGPSLLAFDGTRIYSYSPATFIGSVASTPPQDPLTYNAQVYLRKEGLLAQIKAARKQLHWAWSEETGERLMVLTWSDRGGEESAEMRLNPKADFQPRLIRRSYKYPRPDAYGKVSSVSQIVVSDYREVGGQYFPSKWVRTNDIGFANGKTTHNIAHVELASIETKATIPDDEFVIKFPPGARIHDADKHKIFLVESGGNWKEIPNGDETAPEFNPTPWWARPWVLWPAALSISAVAMWAAWRQFQAGISKKP